MIISHPGSLFSYITLRWILERSVQPGGPPLFVITRSLVKTHFEWLSPSLLLSCRPRRGGRPRVHTTPCIRGSMGPNCGGPKRQYLESACLRMIERGYLPFCIRCSWEIGHRITGVIFNITLFGLVEIYGAFKLRRCIVKICYLIIFSVEVRYVIIWESFGKFAYIYIVNKNRFKIKTQFRF